MNAAQANIVYNAARDLIMANPKYEIALEQCGKCGMNHGTIEGEGEIEGQRWRLNCQVCGTFMASITEEEMTDYMRTVSAILGHNHLTELGAFR